MARSQIARTKRKICVVTNTRADYSRLKSILFALREREDVKLSLCVAGSHLLAISGYTVEDIKQDGFSIDYRTYIEVDGHTPSTMAKSTGLAIIEFSSFFENQRPDIVVVHGDRFEAFAAAAAASMMNIHVAHLQGGEITGTIDEHLRHAITKLSHFHFASDKVSAARIRNLGECSEHVFNAGCPSVDELLSAPLYTFNELKSHMDSRIKKKEWLVNLNKDKGFFLLTYHPVTTEYEKGGQDIEEILRALQQFPEQILVLWPNIDAGSEIIVKTLKDFERRFNKKIAVVNHFPMDIFVNLMRYTKVMIGNSSAGIREACYFGTPVVDIGTRQKGRLQTKNIISVPAEEKKVVEAVKLHLSLQTRYTPEYPYGKGNVGQGIAETLATINLGSPQKHLVSEI